MGLELDHATDKAWTWQVGDLSVLVRPLQQEMSGPVIYSARVAGQRQASQYAVGFGKTETDAIVDLLQVHRSVILRTEIPTEIYINRDPRSSEPEADSD